MLFSDVYGIDKFWEKEWYNVWMEYDVKLFLDPYLIENSKIPEFANTREKINTFFKFIIDKIVDYHSRGERKEVLRYMEQVLIFPEVSQLCLGYSITTKGSGTGGKFASDVYNAIIDFIKELNFKKEDFTHIEILSLFSEGISHDRISDIVANILKEDIIAYTQRICKENKIAVEEFPIPRYRFNFKDECWEDGFFELPKNPNRDDAVFVVPKKFLRRAQTLGFNEFSRFLFNNEPDYLRNRLNITISKQLDKESLLKLIKENPRILERYFQSFYGEGKVKIDYYNYAQDKNLIYYPRFVPLMFLEDIGVFRPKERIFSNEDLFKFVNELVLHFKHNIERQGFYKILRNPSDKIPFREEFIQDLFFFAISRSCDENNVDVSRESRASNGRIEFKFSQGNKSRVFLEIKLASNNKLKEGYQKQIKDYMKAEKITKGIYLVLYFDDDGAKKVNELWEIKNKDNFGDLDIKIIDIDSRIKLPPSKL